MRFKSIVSRILWLHIIVVGSASILMPLALYLLLVRETDALHRAAMHEQADRIAQHVSANANGAWTLDLPEGIRDLYSEAYGRYAYAVVDAGGQVLFSSHGDRSSIFSQDVRSPEPAYMTTRQGNAAMSGASLPKEIAGRKLWIEVAENLSHRELEVLCLIAAGKPLTDIANNLFLSVKTISTYRTRILEKMGMKNNAELMHYAMQHQLVE